MSSIDPQPSPPSKILQVAGDYRERGPHPALARDVACVWTSEISGRMALEVVPDGRIDIYWDGSRLQAAGPNTELVTVEVSRPVRISAVQFRPGVAPRWLNVSAAELVNIHVPLEDLSGKRRTQPLAEQLSRADAPGAAVRLLEAALLEVRGSIPPSDPLVSVTAALATMGRASGDSFVRELARASGWSERTLRRRCQEAFGYGPKTLERILRFQRFVQLTRRYSAPLSKLASEAGYADHAHLVREVRRLSGQVPSRLAAELSGRFDQDDVAVTPAMSPRRIEH